VTEKVHDALKSLTFQYVRSGNQQWRIALCTPDLSVQEENDEIAAPAKL
jgi:hypothetical protein